MGLPLADKMALRRLGSSFRLVTAQSSAGALGHFMSIQAGA
jgi:hypothetical protein